MAADRTIPAWDTHVHAFGPEDRYPVQAVRGYDPPATDIAEYRSEASRVGLGRCVLVQPSIYGADNRALLDALDASGGRDRGVVAPDPDWSRADLQALHERGVRGLRLNLLSAGGNGLASLRGHVGALRDLGWHVAAFLDATAPGVLPQVLDALPVPVVLDHLGKPPRGLADPSDPRFTVLLRAMAERRVWVKLSAPYQASGRSWPWEDVAPFARALVRAAPDRVLFASNWPHVGAADAPGLGALAGTARDWIHAAGVDPQQVFNENPAALYA
ncbi:MAG: amidohydrolase family protein [Alsobacter sp.]